MTATSLCALNALPPEAFVRALGGIYEHSPWVPARAQALAPFETTEALLQALKEVVAAASEAEQLALLRAHPDLAGKAALSGELTERSSSEQAGAGLDRLSPAEYARFHQLNGSYKARFGFPFILAVKGHDKASVLRAFEARLANDAASERQTALEQVHRIARFRLEALLGADA